MDKIEELLIMYRNAAKGLRNLADLQEAQDPMADSIPARLYRAKAQVYDVVIKDLEAIIEDKGN